MVCYDSDIDNIDIACKKLGFTNETINKAQEIAVKYLRKNDHGSQYLIGSFIYIAAILTGEKRNKRTQAKIASACGIGTHLISKWYQSVCHEADIEIIL